MINKCVSGKRSYPTAAMAEDALVEAHIRGHFREGDGPQHVYLCSECGSYHLTSRGPAHPRLVAARKDGSMKRLQEASRWDQKLKHKR